MDYLQIFSWNNNYNYNQFNSVWLHSMYIQRFNAEFIKILYISNSIQNFDFSPENLYKVKRILGNKANEIKHTNYSKICGTTGLVIFLIKDALEYCGIIQNDKKNIPSILLKNLEYLETIENKVDKYIDMLKS